MEHKVLVLYDGEFRFCRFGVDLVHRVDLYSALDFCPFGHPVAEEELEVLPEEERYASFHAVVGDVLHSAVDAARVVFGRYVPDRPALVTVAATEGSPLP